MGEQVCQGQGSHGGGQQRHSPGCDAGVTGRAASNRRSAGTAEASLQPALAVVSYLPAGPQQLVRLPAILRSLVVHFQVGGASLTPDIFRRSIGTRPVAGHETGGISGGGNAGDRDPGQGPDRRA
jgi:hypothetical protein